MKSIKLTSGAFFLAALVSSFSPKSISATTKIFEPNPLTGQWSVTWSNNKVANLETKIVWSLNEDGTGTETITTTAKEANTTLQFPLNWKTTKTGNGHTFIEINYGVGVALNKKDEPVNSLADSIIQKKSNTSISIEYFYYSNDMLYINSYLDGNTAKSELARTRLEKTK